MIPVNPRADRQSLISDQQMVLTINFNDTIRSETANAMGLG